MVSTAGHYKHDLNPDNPLGMKGEVAEAYGSLIEQLWSGSTSSFAPRLFKVQFFDAFVHSLFRAD